MKNCFLIEGEPNIKISIRSREHLLLFYCRKRGNKNEYGKSQKSIKIFML
mgnify:CR=1 FL=1